MNHAHVILMKVSPQEATAALNTLNNRPNIYQNLTEDAVSEDSPTDADDLSENRLNHPDRHLVNKDDLPLQMNAVAFSAIQSSVRTYVAGNSLR